MKTQLMEASKNNRLLIPLLKIARVLNEKNFFLLFKNNNLCKHSGDIHIVFFVFKQITFSVYFPHLKTKNVYFCIIPILFKVMFKTVNRPFITCTFKTIEVPPN